ncbi:MAG TPA: hypothetical protein VFC78_15390 [Tepidisphaeraceae bacterium]|nr:hypothetical protein [Tepidisphaeraceae bacterium]
MSNLLQELEQSRLDIIERDKQEKAGAFSRRREQYIELLRRFFSPQPGDAAALATVLADTGFSSERVQADAEAVRGWDRAIKQSLPDERRAELEQAVAAKEKSASPAIIQVFVKWLETIGPLAAHEVFTRQFKDREVTPSLLEWHRAADEAIAPFAAAAQERDSAIKSDDRAREALGRLRGTKASAWLFDEALPQPAVEEPQAVSPVVEPRVQVNAFGEKVVAHGQLLPA